MQLAHAPTLTARLLGDPLPGRYERAQQLRAFHKVADPDQAPVVQRGSRRDRILAALKDGPRTVRALAELLEEDPGKIRNDLHRLLHFGAVVRQGSGTGMTSTLVWMLAGPDAPPAAAEPRRKGSPDVSAILPRMKGQGWMRGVDVANAMGFSRQRINTVMKYAVADGWVEKTGAGCLARYRLTTAGWEKVA
jgi:hypothetical protein